MPVLGVELLLAVEPLLGAEELPVDGELVTADEPLLRLPDVDAGVPVLDPVPLDVGVAGLCLGLGPALSAGTTAAEASCGIVA